MRPPLPTWICLSLEVKSKPQLTGRHPNGKPLTCESQRLCIVLYATRPVPVKNDAKIPGSERSRLSLPDRSQFAILASLHGAVWPRIAVTARAHLGPQSRALRDIVPSPSGREEGNGKLSRSHKHKRGLPGHGRERRSSNPPGERSHVWNVDGGGAGQEWRFCIEKTGPKAQ